MKIDRTDPPREFKVGKDGGVTLKDCGRLRLAPDEQVTFVTEDGAEHDVARKSWGYYALPSLNARLGRYGLRPVLARSGDGKCFVLLVEKGKEADFNRYMEHEKQKVICWLDDDKVLKAIEESYGG